MTHLMSHRERFSDGSDGIATIIIYHSIMKGIAFAKDFVLLYHLLSSILVVFTDFDTSRDFVLLYHLLSSILVVFIDFHLLIVS